MLFYVNSIKIIINHFALLLHEAMKRRKIMNQSHGCRLVGGSKMIHFIFYANEHFSAVMKQEF